MFKLKLNISPVMRQKVSLNDFTFILYMFVNDKYLIIKFPWQKRKSLFCYLWAKNSCTEKNETHERSAFAYGEHLWYAWVLYGKVQSSIVLDTVRIWTASTKNTLIYLWCILGRKFTLNRHATRLDNQGYLLWTPCLTRTHVNVNFKRLFSKFDILVDLPPHFPST